MAEDRRRRLHLLAPDTGGRVLLDVDGHLPSAVLELDEDETTAAAAVRIAAERYSVRRPVLEVCFDYSASGDEDSSGAARDADIAALVVFEPGPAEDATGVAWDHGDDRSELQPELRRRADTWRAEWRGHALPDPQRARWSRPGWYDDIAAWITDRLCERGRPPTGPVEQRRHWTISAILRIDTAAGRAWAKAVFPGFACEPAVSAFLHDTAPGLVAPVLAHDTPAGWLLLDDIGAAVVSDRPEADDASIRRLVDLQRAFVGRADDLARLGCAVRPWSALAAPLADALADPALRPWLAIDAARAAAIVSWVEWAVGVVDQLGLPDTLVHGDFHPDNVVVHDGRPVIFDWSDAAVAHPFVDAMTWSTWFDDDPARGERAWDTFADAWSDVVPAERVRAARPTLAGLTAAYHTVSYAGIVRGIEPARRDELGTGLTTYGHALDGAVPR